MGIPAFVKCLVQKVVTNCCHTAEGGPKVAYLIFATAQFVSLRLIKLSLSSKIKKRKKSLFVKIHYFHEMSELKKDGFSSSDFTVFFP